MRKNNWSHRDLKRGRRIWTGILAVSLWGMNAGCSETFDPVEAAAPAARPNIVIIYADDVGFGDLSSYGAELVPTPELDRLAAGGVRFTDAYCTASTCTPSRYSLLTGEYAFRNPRAEILAGDAAMLIEPGSVTLPDVLRRVGYRTGVVGKWHLGVGDGHVDWNGEIKPGPLEVGFDRSFIFPATNDRVPTVWMDGHRVHGWKAEDDPIRVSYGRQVGDLPTGVSHPETLRYRADPQHSGTIVNGVSRIGFMDGGQSAWWDDEDMGYEIARRARAFIEENLEQPFFLFMSMPQNHDPRLPHPDFIGRSGIGLRGDDVVELDWVVGDLVAALESFGIRDNTLVIFSSDNGPIFWDGYYQGAVEEANGHRASGPFRGGKYVAYEGGTRVPTIVSWPEGAARGLVSNAMLSQVDLLKSLAVLAGAEVPAGAAVDSRDQLAAWLGHSREGRDHVVQQGIDSLAIRRGDWKLIPATRTPEWVDRKHNRYPNPLSSPVHSSDTHALFNLADDPGETTNLVEAFPEKVDQLHSLLMGIREGRGDQD
jgi:arylsulfatase A-like enzyme